MFDNPIGPRWNGIFMQEQLLFSVHFAPSGLAQDMAKPEHPAWKLSEKPLAGGQVRRWPTAEIATADTTMAPIKTSRT